MGFIKKFTTEFKEFALKGNVVDMAIGVIIGAAFKDIVTSFTDNFISPLINSVGGANIAGSIRLPWVNYEGIRNPPTRSSSSRRSRTSSKRSNPFISEPTNGLCAARFYLLLLTSKIYFFLYGNQFP